MSKLYPSLWTARKDGLNATRTGCREDGVDLDISGVVPAVPSAHADISARGEDASSTHTEHCEQLAHSRRIFKRNIRLLYTVPRADRPRDARLVEQLVGPLKIPVGRPVSQLGEAAVGVVVDDRGQVRHGPGVLSVEVCPEENMAPIVNRANDRHDN